MIALKDLYNGIFYKKRILITGHTGFKGSWLSILLNQLGAEVYGYALEPPTKPNLFEEARVNELVTSYTGDIRDYERLEEVFNSVKPEVIFHMAAQSLVRQSYNDPRETYSVNVMGTVNLFEVIRNSKFTQAVINVTTDKCYENKEWLWGYRENEPLGGYDPYSNSKSCSELVTSSFRDSFFNPDKFEEHGVAVASARAGNVIGGGDWALDRLIPDFIRAISSNKQLKIRSPRSIRPWQFVLEPLNGYLTLAEKLLTEGTKYAGAWNFGPDENDVKDVEWISKNICEMWGKGSSYEIDSKPQPHEATYLKLDCSKAKAELNWYPRWSIKKALSSIVKWNKAWLDNEDMQKHCIRQINKYYNVATT